jgi:hypothetical protein
MSDGIKWWTDSKIITRIMLGIIGTLLLLGLADTQSQIKDKVSEKTFNSEIRAIHEKIDTSNKNVDAKLDLIIKIVEKHENETNARR